MFRIFTFVTLLLLSINLQASLRTPFPLSFGALIYDISYPAGPTSHGTTDPGQWIPEIRSFNNGAKTENQLVNLHPYSSDIEITCTDPGNISTCSILPGFQAGNASAAAYAAAFPNARIMPIVDIAPNYLNNKLLSTSTELADQVAEKLVAQLCSDDNVSGVFLDLEVKNGLANPGIFEFYRKMSSLLASATCVSSSFPKGKYMGIYLTPVGDDWSRSQAMFGSNNNSYIAIPLYDISAFVTPPRPDPISAYVKYVKSVLETAETQSKAHSVPFAILVPAGASFGTFQSYGNYISTPPYFQLIKDFSTSNATQLLFTQTARNAACNISSPYYMGMTYWSYNQYIYSGGFLRMPNIMDSTTITYLQNNSSC